MSFDLARAAAIILALTAAAPAIAGGEMQVKVSYADLDLSSATGKMRFAKRIDTAIKNVCGSPADWELAMAALSRRCTIATRKSITPAIQLAHRNATDRQLAARDLSVTVAP